jgi:unsaturated rhamnogalacturonyl hydrolase
LIQRFFQGRFHSVEEWKQAVLCKNIFWLNHTPTLPANDGNSKKSAKESIQVWQSAAIYISLKEYLSNHQNHDALEETKIFEKQIAVRYKIDQIVDADYGMLAFSLLDNSCAKKLTESMLNYILSNRSDTGEVLYKQKVNNVAFVDTLGFVCPFLVKYGAVTNQCQYIQIAVQQLELYFKNGLEEHSKLPFHAYMIDSHIMRGICDWARGLAWLLIALMDSYNNLPKNSEYVSFFEKYLKEYADILVKLQREDGGFTWQLLSGYQTDSSAIAVFGWYMAGCAKIYNSSEYLERAKRCRSFLMMVTNNDGTIDYCQGDTIGIGVYSRKFDRMPFAQGFALRMHEEIEDAERKIKL